MGIQKRTQIKYKQENKRKRRRLRISKAGKKPDEYFSSGIYIGKGTK